jgi:hypothetical protein
MSDDNSSEKRRPPDQQEIGHLIRERAHQLWEAAGSPADRSTEFWHCACELIETKSRSSQPPAQPA